MRFSLEERGLHTVADAGPTIDHFHLTEIDNFHRALGSSAQSCHAAYTMAVSTTATPSSTSSTPPTLGKEPLARAVLLDASGTTSQSALSGEGTVAEAAKPSGEKQVL